jgi:hypothetical protein
MPPGILNGDRYVSMDILVIMLLLPTGDDEAAPMSYDCLALGEASDVKDELWPMSMGKAGFLAAGLFAGLLPRSKEPPSIDFLRICVGLGATGGGALSIDFLRWATAAAAAAGAMSIDALRS